MQPIPVANNGVNTMAKVTFNLPEGYVFETKINGQPIAYDPAKMHESWLIAFLEKGMQRFANDKYSGEKGQTKFDLCAEIARQANSGDEMPEAERGSRRASVPDDVALAIRNAKADLTVRFKRLTGEGKIANMVAADKRVAKYFEEKGDNVVWKDDAVQTWIDKQKESGTRDYLAEAQAALAVDVEEIDI